MDLIGVKMERYIKSLGWPAYIGITIVFLISVSNAGFFGMIMYTVVSIIGAIVGNYIRLHGSPNGYFTDGTAWGGFKAKFYWKYGPQWFGAIGTPLGLFVILLYSGNI